MRSCTKSNSVPVDVTLTNGYTVTVFRHVALTTDRLVCTWLTKYSFIHSTK